MSLAFVSRAPQAEIQGLKERMGWELIPWYTITDDFDKDFGVDEWHGTNAFVRDGERIYRTYFVDLSADPAVCVPTEQRASASCAARWTRARTWSAVMLRTGRVPPSWPARA